MSLEFSVETKKLEEMQEYLNQLEKRIDLEDLRIQQELSKRLQTVMFRDLEKRFASSPPTVLGGTVYGGSNWRALSDSYLRNRPDRAQGKIYIDTGALKESLVSLTPNTISSFESGTEYKFGTRIPYAEKLQKMRQIIYWHPELVEEIAQVYLDFVIEKEK
jgi:phage gpG-like protein